MRNMKNHMRCYLLGDLTLHRRRGNLGVFSTQFPPFFFHDWANPICKTNSIALGYG